MLALLSISKHKIAFDVSSFKIMFNQVKDTLGKDVMYSCPGGCSRKQLENKVTFLFSLSISPEGFFRIYEERLLENLCILECIKPMGMEDGLQGYKEFTVHIEFTYIKKAIGKSMYS